MRYVCAVVAGAVITLLTGTLANGQATATLRGRVRDAQAAPVASATVTVTSPDTGLRRVVPTAVDGTFIVANLPPSIVDLAVTATGFADASRRGLVLEVGQTMVVDVELAVAGVRETVDVSTGGRRRGHHPVGRRRRDSRDGHRGAAAQRPQLPRAGAARARQRAGAELRSDQDELGRRSPRPDSSGAAATSRSTAPTTTTTWSAGRCRTSPRSRCRSSRSPPTASRRSPDAPPRRSSTSSPSPAPISSAARLSFFARDSAWQGLPATYDRSTGDTVPFDRQQIAGAVGGPLVAGRLFWFGAVEYRNQDGAVLVGARDVAARTIRRSFAPAPLDDLLWLGARRLARRAAPTRVDGALRGRAAPTTPARARSIGRSDRRRSGRRAGTDYQSVVGIVDAHRGARRSSTRSRCRSARSTTRSLRSRPARSSRSRASRTARRSACRRAPTQTRFQLADTVTLVRGAHTMRAGGEWQRVDAAFDLGVFQEGRIEFVRGLRRLRPQRRRPRRR